MHPSAIKPKEHITFPLRFRGPQIDWTFRRKPQKADLLMDGPSETHPSPMFHTRTSPDLRGLLVLLQLQVLQHANGTLVFARVVKGDPKLVFCNTKNPYNGWWNINSLFSGTLYHSFGMEESDPLFWCRQVSQLRVESCKLPAICHPLYPRLLWCCRCCLKQNLRIEARSSTYQTPTRNSK